MKKINFFGLLMILFFVARSCVTSVPMNSEYLSKPSKVGVFVNFNEPQKYREGSQGLLDLAVTSGDKYQPLLDFAKTQIDRKHELENIYAQALKARGKEVVIIDEKFDPKTTEKFKGDKQEGKKYYTYDLRYLKDKYQVDEVVFVNVDWGVIISYYSMIETGRSGYAYLQNKVVNLQDNSLYFSNDNAQTEIIKGKWNVAPSYENAISKIDAALNKAISVEKDLFK